MIDPGVERKDWVCQAFVFEEHTSIHHDLKACGACSLRCLLMYDPELHPEDPGGDADAFFHEGWNELTASENQHHVYLFPHTEEIRIRRMTEPGLDIWIHWQNIVSDGFQICRHGVTRSPWIR